MTDLERKTTQTLATEKGLTVAPCNRAGTRLKLETIKAMRAEKIDPDEFADAMALICERFDRELSAGLLRQYYAAINEVMGALEFQAAFKDFWGTKMFFADVCPYFINHVKQQRENGPDLGALAFAEATQRGADND